MFGNEKYRSVPMGLCQPIVIMNPEVKTWQEYGSPDEL